MITLCLYLIISIISQAFGQTSNFTFLGYDTISPSFTVGSGDEATPVWEISGLSSLDEGSSTIFYGVSDTILQSFPKRIFSFKMSDEYGTYIPQITTSNIDGVILEDPGVYSLDTADTETIIYVEDDDYNPFFIIGTEGYRQYGTYTNFWVYNVTGEYLGNVSYNTAIFQEQGTHENPTSGFGEGDGIEAMSVSLWYKTMIFIGSNTLVQDECDQCVRVSVNSMDYSGEILSWDETRQYLYQKDSAEATVVDAAIVTKDLSIVVVLEKLELGEGNYSIKAYAVDLSEDTMGDDFDVQDCQAITFEGCENYGRYGDKTLIADFRELGYDIPNVETIDFDAISVGVGTGCFDGYFLMAASDNNEVDNTYFAYFCYNPYVDDYIDTDHDTDSGINDARIRSIIFIVAIFNAFN